MASRKLFGTSHVEFGCRKDLFSVLLSSIMLPSIFASADLTVSTGPQESISPQFPYPSIPRAGLLRVPYFLSSPPEYRGSACEWEISVFFSL